MSIIDRVRALNLPDDHYVVIGSGLLDAWGLREAGDVDLVMSDELFDTLSIDARFHVGDKHGDRCLSGEGYEIFDRWEADSPFARLYADSIIVDGVRFVSPEYLIAWKSGRNSEKDQQDIVLLQERLRHER